MSRSLRAAAQPELTLDTEHQSPEESAGKILSLLEDRQLIPAAQPA